MERWSDEIHSELNRISRDGERDALWSHFLVNDQLMTMRFECRPHKEDCDGRYDYFCEVFPIVDALQALKKLPEGYGIDAAVFDVLFELPTRLPYERSEPMITALADAEGNWFRIMSSPDCTTPDAVQAAQTDNTVHVVGTIDS